MSRQGSSTIFWAALLGEQQSRVLELCSFTENAACAIHAEDGAMVHTPASVAAFAYGSGWQ